MGLAERKAVKLFQDNRFPALKKEIDEAAGFEVPIEVNWDSLAKSDYAHVYDAAFTGVYFTPLIAALKAIAADDMGREALRGMKKVILCAVQGGYGEDAIQFADGVLTIDHDPVTNVNDVTLRAEVIQKKLEAGL